MYSLRAESLYLHYRIAIPRHSKCMNQNIKNMTFQNLLKPWIFLLPGFSRAWKCHVFHLFFVNKRDSLFSFIFNAIKRLQELSSHCLALADMNEIAVNMKYPEICIRKMRADSWMAMQKGQSPKPYSQGCACEVWQLYFSSHLQLRCRVPNT